MQPELTTRLKSSILWSAIEGEPAIRRPSLLHTELVEPGDRKIGKAGLHADFVALVTLAGQLDAEVTRERCVAHGLNETAYDCPGGHIDLLELAVISQHAHTQRGGQQRVGKDIATPIEVSAVELAGDLSGIRMGRPRMALEHMGDPSGTPYPESTGRLLHQLGNRRVGGDIIELKRSAVCRPVADFHADRMPLAPFGG
eukprot:2843183-Prymnesium_polylepis.1